MAQTKITDADLENLEKVISKQGASELTSIKMNKQR